MLDPKFQKFTTATQILASYDYVDIIDGTGVVEYYGAIDKFDGNLTLTPNFITGYDFKIMDTNTYLVFDTAALNLPRTIKGTAYIEWAIYNGGGNIPAMTTKVSYVRGGAAVDISAAVTNTLTTTDPNVAFNIVPLTQTDLQVGDIIRVSIKVNNANHRLEFDSASPFKVKIPFLIT